MIYSKFVWVVVGTLLGTGFALTTDVETRSQPGLHMSVLLRHQSPPNRVQMRTSTPSADKWTPTPLNWFFGTWYFVYSNQASYKSWRNMQWTLSPRYPNTPDDTLNDVVTYQHFNSSDTTLYYIYGVDFPTVTDNITQYDEYDWKPSGALAFAFNTFKVIAWGYDEDGVPYAALYETRSLGQTEESFDIISRSDRGPCNTTLTMISKAVDDLGIASLTRLKDEAMAAPLVQDGGRVGQSYPLCNSTCMANAHTGLGLRRSAFGLGDQAIMY